MPVETIFLSLQPPAAIYFDTAEWPLEKSCYISGVRVVDEVPWCANADLLIDPLTREFIGVTFQLRDRWDWPSARRLAERLDPQVVHYDDISSHESKQRYVDESGKAERFEILWAPRLARQYQLAQLPNGQWLFWSEERGEWDASLPFKRPLIAFAMSGVSEVLRDHGLTFPEAARLPPLRVDWC